MDTQHPYLSTLDPPVRAAFERQLAEEGLRIPGLHPLLSHGREDLFPRFAGYYEHLCRLPRRARRALQRQWKRSLSAIALLLALGQPPALAATIAVNGTTCTLAEAIVNANDGAQTHLDCAAGAFGADTLELVAGSTHLLTAVDNSSHGPSGLPVVISSIVIEGHGSTITRDAGAPKFRILAVDAGGDLTLNETIVSGGVALRSGGGIANYGGA